MIEQSRVNPGANRLTTVLLVVYLMVLYWILLLKLGVRFSYMGERRTNFVPFNEPFIFTSENILNLVVFVPLGIYAGILFQKWPFDRKLLFVFSLSLLVEGLQYILKIGAFDTTDILTNTLGGLTGFVLFGGLEKVFNSSFTAQKFINIIATIGTVLLIVLLVLLKMKMLPVRYQ